MHPSGGVNMELVGVERRYGVPRYSLFSVADLFEERDLQRVLDCLEALAIKATSNGVEPKYEVEADKAQRLPKLPSFSSDLSKADRRATRLMNRGRPLPTLPKVPPSSTPPTQAPPTEPGKPVAPLVAGKSATAAPSATPSVVSPRKRPMPVTPLSLPQAGGPPQATALRSPQSATQSPKTETDSPPARKPSIGSPPHSSSAPKIPLPTSPRERVATLENSVTRLVAAARGRLARRVHQQRVTDVAYRARVATEILSTENVYVKSLKMIKSLFLDPLMASTSSPKPLLPLDDVKSIFSSLEVIVAYNERLLSQLQPRVESWSPNQRLGDIFIQICGFLKVYTNYIANYNASITTLNRCRTKKDKFSQWLAEAEQKPELNGLKLGALLILPVQRIPRYQLLLSDLSKHTWAAHADYADLLKATTSIQEVAIYLNDKKREADNITKVTEIQEQFTWDEDLAQPHRRFVKEITFKAVSGKEREFKERKFYFFNDLIVVTKPHRSTPLGMQFLAKASDKSKEKVISSHPINSIVITTSPSFAPSGYSSMDALFEVRDPTVASSDITKGIHYLADAGSAAMRDEIIAIYQHNSAEQKGKLVPMDADGKPILKSPAGSRPSSYKPDKDENSGESKDSKDSKDLKEPKDDKRKHRPSRGKELLSSLRSTLHGDPRKSREMSFGQTSLAGPNGINDISLEESSSASDVSKPQDSAEMQRSDSSNGLKRRLSSGPKLKVADHSTPSMPSSALSPRSSHSHQEPEKTSNGAHHNALAGALSPRSSPPEPDDSISGARRASFKRSMTERPAVPPKPDRLRSGLNVAAGVAKKTDSTLTVSVEQRSVSQGNPGTNPPSMQLPALPKSSGGLVTEKSDSSLTASDSSPTNSSISAPAPIRRAGTVAGETGTLRRQNAFKSRTLTSTTVDLLSSASSASSTSGVSPLPSPRNSVVSSSDSSPSSELPSSDTNVGASNSGSNLNRPTRQAPSPRASISSSK